MNIRYAVLCARLRAHARVEQRLFQRQVGEVESEIRDVRTGMSEEELLTIEEHLGLRLPEMLRTLYLVNGSGDLDIVSVAEQAQGLHEARQSKQERRTLRWVPELVETLRQHPGSYISLGEDGIPLYLPDRFVQLVVGTIGGDPGVMLDGHTGYLYFDEFYIDFDLPDHEWSHLSFAAPSVEDWLERRLDGGSLSDVPYFPKQDRNVRIVREGEWLRLAEPYSDMTLPLPPLEQTNARDETRRLREETLGDAGSDPLDKAVDFELRRLQIMTSKLPEVRESGSNEDARHIERMQQRYEKNPSAVASQFRKAYVNDVRVAIERSGWRLKRLRHELLREMYALMEVLENEQEELREEGEEDLPLREESFLAELRPLIEAEAQLLPLTERIAHGISQVFVENRVSRFGLPHRESQFWQQRWIEMSTSGRYQEADTGYEQALGKAPGVAELWLGRAQNAQRWGEADAKAGKQQSAHEHLALAVEYAQHAMTLAPRNRRYPRVLASIRQTLEALDHE